ncbi:MAG: MMPL family transporter, partial [Spirosomataceae bacterium]
MLWNKISNLILNNRKIWLFAIVLITALMGYFSSQLQLSYELAKILPESDPAFQRYEDFKKRYGEDGNVMIIAIESDKMYDLDFFNKWYDLNKKIKAVSGVKNVASNASLFEIQRNDSLKRFDVVPLVAVRPATQADVDSIKNKIAQYPFYKGFVYSEEGNAHLMAITLKQADLNSKRRLSISGEIQEISDEFGKVANVDIHYSGMPYIRTNFMSKVRDELIMFMILAFLTTTGILYLFFRSFRVVFFAVLVVLTAVIWSVGFIYLFGYKITILTGMIPPLIMIIGIPNTIFLINKYQEEFLKSKNQLVALGTSIEKIGKTTFIANVTTFIGFFVFYFTGSPFLVEFGLVAA